MAITTRGLAWRILNSITGQGEPDGDTEVNEDGLRFTMKTIVRMFVETKDLLATINEEML